MYVPIGASGITSNFIPSISPYESFLFFLNIIILIFNSQNHRTWWDAEVENCPSLERMASPAAVTWHSWRTSIGDIKSRYFDSLRIPRVIVDGSRNKHQVIKKTPCRRQNNFKKRLKNELERGFIAVYISTNIVHEMFDILISLEICITRSLYLKYKHIWGLISRKMEREGGHVRWANLLRFRSMGQAAK
jgi:hypothetical protein